MRGLAKEIPKGLPEREGDVVSGGRKIATDVHLTFPKVLEHRLQVFTTQLAPHQPRPPREEVVQVSVDRF
jgi:hypothetical protein